ncbi:unknown protein (Partial), partial [Seminavis robusta]|eukprot:Sro237_g095160.1 n/a (112) ;mRNA; r:2-338
MLKKRKRDLFERYDKLSKRKVELEEQSDRLLRQTTTKTKVEAYYEAVGSFNVQSVLPGDGAVKVGSVPRAVAVSASAKGDDESSITQTDKSPNNYRTASARPLLPELPNHCS